MICFSFFILNFISISNGFFLTKNTLKKNVFSFKMIYDLSEDLNIFRKFSLYLPKDSYNDVVNNILNNKLSKIIIDNNYKQLLTIDNLPKDNFLHLNYHLVDINPIVLPNLIEKSTLANIPVYFANLVPQYVFNFQDLLVGFYNLINNAIPVLFFIYILAIFRNINSGPRPPSSMNINKNFNSPFGLSFKKKEIEKISKPNISLTSWCGSPEVLEECKEVISYVENKEKFKIIGADMPKGILLEGPPGTGKTLLAKAIASETNSTFISISGSAFVEMFVGMGASRVRELFDTARENRPCIIFIDEIDAVGRQRGNGANFANDEREQTLNQILYEMDGFNNNNDILVIAATNRKDILDQALLRPGRFDRIVQIPLPDKQSREKILEFYLKNINLNNKPDISSISELTEGFSGAQLKNLVNEAAIISVRNNYSHLQERYIYDAYEKLLVGIIKKNTSTLIDTKKIRVSIHESGHALLVLNFKEYFNFQKASIQSTYNGAGGYTLFNEKTYIREGGLYTKDILKNLFIIIY